MAAQWSGGPETPRVEGGRKFAGRNKQAAEMFAVPQSEVSTARKLLRTAPGLAAAVLRGELVDGRPLTVSKALKLAGQAKWRQQHPAPEDAELWDEGDRIPWTC